MAHRTILLLSLYILGIYRVDSSPSLGPSSLNKWPSNPSSQSDSKISTDRLSTQSHNASQTRSSSNIDFKGPHGQTSNITAAPPVTSMSLDFAEQAGICYLGQQDCTYTGMTRTVVGPDKPLHLSEECLLWNNSCTGNKTLALEEFFSVGTLNWLEENECFVKPENASLDCSKYVAQNVLSEFAVIKDWMRSPQCLSSNSEFQLMQGQTPLPHSFGQSCCNYCEISGQNVDVYYWPDADADTSCLSIVGSSVNPPLYGATRSVTTPDPLETSTITYWGCNVEDSFSGQSYMTTALLTSIGDVTFKQALVNPWSAPSCIEKASALPSSTISVEARRFHASIHARGHSLVLPPNVTQMDGLLITTAVMEGFTL